MENLYLDPQLNRLDNPLDLSFRSISYYSAGVLKDKEILNCGPPNAVSWLVYSSMVLSTLLDGYGSLFDYAISSAWAPMPSFRGLFTVLRNIVTHLVEITAKFCVPLKLALWLHLSWTFTMLLMEKYGAVAVA
ncbi:hypothetical protein Dimus_011957 [Dionaea muscipula]